jgi:hypothetical protein
MRRIAIPGRVVLVTMLGVLAPSWPRAAEVVADSSELYVGSPLPDAADGWRISGRVIEASASARKPLVLPLRSQPDAPLPLAGFDAIWADYVIAPGLPPCRLDFELRLARKPLSRPRDPPHVAIASTQALPLVVVATSTPASHAWKAKDFWYLAARFLGVPPNEEWQYAYGPGGDLVVQRRWRQDLRGVEAIDLAIDHSPAPSQVNLVIETDRGTEVLPLEDIPADSRLPDGRPGVRLPVRPALSRRYPARWPDERHGTGLSFVLKETIVFFRSGTAPARNPVTEVSFLRRGSAFEAQPAEIFAEPAAKHVQAVAQGHERSVMPLGSFTAGSDAELLQAVAVLRSPAPAAPCVLRLERARLVNTYRR